LGNPLITTNLASHPRSLREKQALPCRQALANREESAMRCKLTANGFATEVPCARVSKAAAAVMGHYPRLTA
jgi:hypothetical protein